VYIPAACNSGAVTPVHMSQQQAGIHHSIVWWPVHPKINTCWLMWARHARKSCSTIHTIKALAPYYNEAVLCSTQHVIYNQIKAAACSFVVNGYTQIITAPPKCRQSADCFQVLQQTGTYMYMYSHICARVCHWRAMLSSERVLMGILDSLPPWGLLQGRSQEANQCW